MRREIFQDKARRSNRGARRRLQVERLERRELLAGWVVNSSVVNGDDPGLAVAVDAQGNSYVTGYFRGTMNFGATTLNSAGEEDAYIAKVDSGGQFVWARSAGGAGLDIGRSIAVDGAGNVYVTGGFSGQATFGGISLEVNSGSQGNAFVAKMDPANGDFQWVKRAGNEAEADGIAADASGNVYVVGRFRGGADGTGDFDGIPLPNHGDVDRFAARLDANGAVQWVQRRGGAGFDYATGVAVDPDPLQNLLYVTWADDQGQYVLSKLDPATGQVLWDEPAAISGSDLWEGKIALTHDQGTPVIYMISNTAQTYLATTLTKFVDLGHAGSTAWRKEGAWAQSIAADSQGNVYGAGAALWLDNPTHDFDSGPGRAILASYNNRLVSWIWKFGPDGELLALRPSAIGDGDAWGVEATFGIAVDSGNNIYTTGAYSGGTAHFDVGDQFVEVQSARGMYLLKTTQDTGNIFGHAFNDLDNNGAWDNGKEGNDVWTRNDPGEPSLAGAMVYIDSNNSGSFENGEPTATVQPWGEYRFPHVAPGTHTVRLLPPNGMTQSSPKDANGDPMAATVNVAAGNSNANVDFGAYAPSETNTYASTDVPKKSPRRSWQVTQSKLTIADAYPIFGIDVSVSATSDLVRLTLVAPDETRTAIGLGTTHLNTFNYKDVYGVWILEIGTFDPWPSYSVTAWSMAVLGQAPAPPPPPPPPTPGVTVSPTSGLQTTEQGGSDSFTVVLNTQPADNVTIPVSSSDATEGSVSTSSLTFTPQNWSVAQTVVITGVDDTVRDGNIAYTIVLGAAASTDSAYQGLNPDDVSATNVDNEKGKIKNNSLSLSTASNDSGARVSASREESSGGVAASRWEDYEILLTGSSAVSPTETNEPEVTSLSETNDLDQALADMDDLLRDDVLDAVMQVMMIDRLLSRK